MSPKRTIEFIARSALFLVGLVFSIAAGLATSRDEWFDIFIIGEIARQQTGY